MYDLFQQDPGMFIINALISIVLTLVGYGTFPVIFARTRKQFVTKRKYKWLCYGINILVMFLFAIFRGGVASGGPYFLWTWVFSRYGMKELGRRSVMPESDQFVAKDGQKTECQKCGYIERYSAGFCPKCNSRRLKFIYGPTQEVHTSPEPKIVLTAPIDENKEEPLTLADTRICFCRKCGTNLNEASRFCHKCGTKIVKE